MQKRAGNQQEEEETRKAGWLTLPARIAPSRSFGFRPAGQGSRRFAPVDEGDGPDAPAASADAPASPVPSADAPASAAPNAPGSVASGIDPETYAAAKPQSDLLLGRYVLEGQAGKGGFASVMAAWDTRIERRVAIKCMPLDESASALFPEGGSILLGSKVDTSAVPGLEEARTAAKLSDSSIVQVYDFEVQDGMAYLIMEYVDGISLGGLLAEYPDEVDADVVCAVFKAVARALQTAHAHHVLHLDIKPDNVLIDQEGHVKVADFGLARLAGEAGYGAAEGGTIGYMPPEQMQQKELDERCDEWALASLTYEMISGENPFLANSIPEAEDAIYDAEIIIPSLCMEELDPGVDDVMFTALDPDPDERYATVQEFAEALLPCLGGPRKGTNKLKRLVGSREEEASEQEGALDPEADSEFEQEAAYREPQEPWRPSPLMKSAFMRVWAAAGAAVLGFLSVGSIGAPDAWGSPISWGVLAAIVALAAIIPWVGAPVACVAVGVSLCVLGSPVLGLVLIAATGAWWYFIVFPHRSTASSDVGVLPALLGSFGFTPFMPFAAGYLLRPLEAAATSLFAAVLALCLAGLGSAQLAGWDAITYASVEFGPNAQAIVSAMLSVPSTWATVVAWVLAAVVSSLLCGTGKRVWCVVGMVLAGLLLIAAVAAGSLLDSNGHSLLANPLALLPVICAIVVGVSLACIAAPSRALEEPGE